MASTTLDPNTALIVVDLQKGIAGYPLIHPIGEVVDQTRALLDAFRGCGLPIVLVNVAGRAPGRTERGPRASLSFTEGWTDFLPELDQQPNDIVATKRTWGAFASTDLEDRLKAFGVTQVVVTGVATSSDGETGLRTRLQRCPRARRHDRHAPRSPRIQHRERLPADWRDRHEPGDH